MVFYCKKKKKKPKPQNIILPELKPISNDDVIPASCRQTLTFPTTMDIFTNPYIAPNDQTYDRYAIINWLESNKT